MAVSNNYKLKIKLFTICAFSLVTAVSLMAQENSTPEQLYQMPPEEIAALIDAPPSSSVSFGPNNKWMLIIGRANLKSIEEVSQPELRLAGLRINPRTNGPSRVRYYNSLTIKNIDNLKEIEIAELPDNPQISNINWSLDGQYIAFTLTVDNSIQLWVADVKSARARHYKNIIINDVYGTPYHWLPDNSLLCKTIPSGHGNVPNKPLVPVGPVIQENLGKTAQAATYADLLKNKYDEQLMEYYLNTQLVRVNLNNEITPVSKDDFILYAKPSPDGQYLLVGTLQKPYSYLVNVNKFPRKIEIWDTDGNIIRLVANQSLAEDIPNVTCGVRTGPREFNWRADQPATLYYAMAQDNGDPRIEAEVRDQIYTLSAPFKGSPIPLFSLTYRYDYIQWGNSDVALITEWWWKTRNIKTWAFAPDKAQVAPELIFDYSWQDRYNNPGYPLTEPNVYGRRVLKLADKGTSLLLVGTGASPEGDRPFLDKLNLVNKKSARLWRSEAPYYESVVKVIDSKNLKIITRREAIKEPPNYFYRELKKDKITTLTEFPHPTPQLTNVRKELIRYTRDDGVEMTAKLYLPEGFQAGDDPLPMLMWAYPREYKSAEAAGQVNDSPYRFVRTGWWSPLLWLTRGYAILDGPTMPIIGEDDDEPNDQFVEQLVASAQAAVNEVVRRGVADRDRIAIGGHSYGAFMTANLLAHSDLYRAGIARTGAYNRTLTPFGFQSEDRTFWEAPEVYFRMSPFMHADSVDEPILLTHGTADNNPGTFPIQSERFYNALKGHGATARLVMLPHESHSYRARENIMHMLWETDRWLEKYVKNVGPREEKEVAEETE